MKNIDMLVAKKVMGWIVQPDVDLYVTEADSLTEAWKPIPYFSQDLAAAWQIDKPGWRWEFSELSCGLDVILWSESGDLEKLGQAYILWDSVPDKATAYCLARCRAALEAVGVDWEAENDL